MKSKLIIILFFTVSCYLCSAQTEFGVSGGPDFALHQVNLNSDKGSDRITVLSQNSGYQLNVYAEDHFGNYALQSKLFYIYNANPATEVANEKVLQRTYRPFMSIGSTLHFQYNIFDNHYFFSVGAGLAGTQILNASVQTVASTSLQGQAPAIETTTVQSGFDYAYVFCISNGARIPFNGKMGAIFELSYQYQGTKPLSNTKVKQGSSTVPSGYIRNVSVGIFYFSAGIYIIPEFHK
ncbi:MAG: hypothetical protein Q8M15_05210 [Bacteroidota bacterium]|nr:hypothetical protein [Bacteroidota bacterium]